MSVLGSGCGKKTAVASGFLIVGQRGRTRNPHSVIQPAGWTSIPLIRTVRN